MLSIPEIVELDSHRGFVRVPPELDIPLTDRVRRLIDTRPFRRLSKITQVGLVSLVYPAARHTRFEHSLGVYRLALMFLKRLAHDERFTRTVSIRDAQVLIVAALLHDLGHWPFCHLIEDIRIDGLPHHEALADDFFREEEIARLLQNDWEIGPEEISNLLRGKFSSEEPAQKLLASILSGPIDIDKMDYLFRDSLHAGVPYGRNLDQQRLVGSLCVNEAGDGLAITEKGKTAAELMIFARYIMFSEVYWHHAVRAATTMLQRLVRELYRDGSIDKSFLFIESEDDAIRLFRKQAQGKPSETLAEGLFGRERSIYKRVAQFSILEHPELYRKLAGRPYPELCMLADRLSEAAQAWYPADRSCYAILIDAPPVEKEVEIKIDVFYPKERRYRSLEDVSPVVRAMAREQFDDYAKRVRIFAHPDIATSLRQESRFFELLEKECSKLD